MLNTHAAPVKLYVLHLAMRHFRLRRTSIHPSLVSALNTCSTYCVSLLMGAWKCVRVAWEDTDMTKILSFEKTHSSPTASSLTIHIPRITPPHPDYSTPQKLPLHLLTHIQSIGELAANTRIKDEVDGSEVVRQAREAMCYDTAPEMHQM
ncbi:hypothetical protein EDB19DRAFT_1775887 [Suillus lakei]|nr:hypothetical protein EDB19DRAFT_1775887 [Suillus lakei]